MNNATTTPCVSTPAGEKAKESLTRAELLVAREAYVEGAMRASDWSRTYSTKIAALRFPLPMKKVPREARVKSGFVYRILNGEVEYKSLNSTAGWFTTGYTVEDFKKFGELAANPTCEVEDTDDE